MSAAAAAAPAPKAPVFSGFRGPVAEAVAAAVARDLAPVHLEVHNESASHCVPKNSETHFKVVVVSAAFDGVPLVKRHRMVNAALREQLDAGVHALSIVARTEAQFAANSEVKPSPACLGGAAK